MIESAQNDARAIGLAANIEYPRRPEHQRCDDRDVPTRDIPIVVPCDVIGAVAITIEEGIRKPRPGKSLDFDAKRAEFGWKSAEPRFTSSLRDRRQMRIGTFACEPCPLEAEVAAEVPLC